MAHVRVGGSTSEDGQQCTLVVYLVLVESLGLAWHRVASQSRCFARRPRSNVHSCSQHHQRRRRHRRLTVDEQLILCQHHDRHHPFSRRRAQRLHTVLSPIFTAHHFTCGSPNESGASTRRARTHFGLAPIARRGQVCCFHLSLLHLNAHRDLFTGQQHLPLRVTPALPVLFPASC